MPETRTVKGFSEVLLPLAEGDFESGPFNHLGTSPYDKRFAFVVFPRRICVLRKSKRHPGLEPCV